MTTNPYERIAELEKENRELKKDNKTLFERIKSEIEYNSRVTNLPYSLMSRNTDLQGKSKALEKEVERLKKLCSEASTLCIGCEQSTDCEDMFGTPVYEFVECYECDNKDTCESWKLKNSLENEALKKDVSNGK